MKISGSAKPIRYLKPHASEIVNDISQSIKPLVLAQYGEAKLVLQDVISFKQPQESFALLRILMMSESDKAKGSIKPAREAFVYLPERIDGRTVN